MDLKAKHLSNTCSDPIEFLRQLRQTTEPIGGGTAYSEDGEFVEYQYKPVVQYDIAGNYITEYPSIKDAANAFCRDGHVFGARKYITECCKHQRASYRGSKFEFKKLPKKMEDIDL